jgi:hypothetical protein
VFTTPLHNNESYLIVACAFVAAEMCLPSRCLAMDVYYDFAVPSFRRHVTIRRLFTEFDYIIKRLAETLLNILCHPIFAGSWVPKMKPTSHLIMGHGPRLESLFGVKTHFVLKNFVQHSVPY